MKKFLNVILAAALLCLGLQSFAQNDIRQRNSGTVVADVLAEMPAQNASVLESNMKDLAAFAPESIRLLGEMLVPAGKGDNSRVEYALSAHLPLRMPIPEQLSSTDSRQLPQPSLMNTTAPS